MFVFVICLAFSFVITACLPVGVWWLLLRLLSFGLSFSLCLRFSGQLGDCVSACWLASLF